MPRKCGLYTGIHKAHGAALDYIVDVLETISKERRNNC